MCYTGVSKDVKRHMLMAKPPTIHDVAQALGMHKSTVSLALSGKGNIADGTRERVRSVAHEIGYAPNPLAQRLANGAHNPTVCIVSGTLDVGLATEKILLIQHALSAEALEAPIYTCSEGAGQADRSQAAQIRQICRQRPRAVICAAQMIGPAVFPELEAYQRAGGVVVSYDVSVPLECDQVVFDREDNTDQAARCLLERGHRRIGLGMSNPPPWLSHTVGLAQNLRVAGFRRALEEFGAPFREDDWLFQNSTYEKGGAEMARRFLRLTDRPTGLCIVNDYVALAFMVEIVRAGVRVPQDVSLVGLDDQPIAAYCPVPLTSISQPTEEIARAVVTLLRDRLAGSAAAPETVTVRGKLRERASVAAPP